MKVEREKLFNLRVSTDERAQLEALAHAEGEPASTLMRRWIRQHYEARFGNAAPAKTPRAASSR